MPVVQLELDSTGAIKSLQQFDNAADATAKASETAFGKVRKSVNDIAEAALKMMATAGAAVVAVGLASLDSAARMQEAQNKYDVVFEGMTATTDEWVKNLREHYALSELAAKDYLSSTKAVLDGTRMESDAAAKLSNQLVLLAQDLASFHDKAPEDAVRAMTAALTGEMESMKQFGVVIKSEEVTLRAMTKNHLNNADAVTQAMRAEATYELILLKSGKARGDTIRSQESYTFQLKQTKAMLEDIKVEIGENFIPIATEVLKIFQAWVKDNDAVNKAMLYTVQVLRFVHQGIQGLVLIGDAVVMGFAAFFDFMIQGFLAIMTPLNALGNALLEMGVIENNPFEKLREAADNFKESSKDVFNAQIQKIEETDAAYEKLEERIKEQSRVNKEQEGTIESKTEALNKEKVAIIENTKAVSGNHREMINIEGSVKGLKNVNGVWEQIEGTTKKAAQSTAKVADAITDEVIPAVNQGIIPAEVNLRNRVNDVIMATDNSVNSFKNQGEAFEEYDENSRVDERGFGKGNKISGTVSAHGNTLSPEDWQALPEYQKTFLGQKALEGRTSYDYFSSGGPGGQERFRQGSGYDEQALGIVAEGMNFVRSNMGQAANINNYFNQQISRSDVIGIIEESNRSIARA